MKVNSSTPVIRYSEAFKKKVVSEFESGKFSSIAEASRVYDIRGSETVTRWIKKYGRFTSLPVIMRVEMKDEKDRIKQLEKEKKALEHALGKMQMKNLILESTIEYQDRFLPEHAKRSKKKTDSKS